MYMRLILILLASMWCSTLAGQAPGSPAWILGHWQGEGYQPPTQTHWSIDLWCDPLTGQFTIDYPTLGCGGIWQIRQSNPDRLDLQEIILVGKTRCDNLVNVVVQRIDEEYIAVSYFIPSLYDGVVAHAVLRKMDRT